MTHLLPFYHLIIINGRSVEERRLVGQFWEALYARRVNGAHGPGDQGRSGTLQRVLSDLSVFLTYIR